MKYTFDSLLEPVHPNGRRRKRRNDPKGNAQDIEPQTLLRLYGDPELAIAGAIIQRAAMDVRNTRLRDEVLSFISSKWFLVIAKGLDFRTLP
jgi:hypothetical protein